jgi:hypothetical protein
VIFICDEFGVWDFDYEQKCRQNTHVEAYVKFVTRRLYVCDILAVNLCIVPRYQRLAELSLLEYLATNALSRLTFPLFQ